MQKCLGIYVENNLIKYAKVSKERDDVKIESFGIRFFQDINEEIRKIVEETYSFSTPICMNLANEKSSDTSTFTIFIPPNISL